MSDAITFNLQLAVSDHGVFEALTVELVASARTEPGTLAYEFFVSDDGAVCHTNERFRDSESALAHLGTFGSKFAERFMACADVTAFTVWGPASPALREALSAFGPLFLRELDGFAR